MFSERMRHLFLFVTASCIAASSLPVGLVNIPFVFEPNRGQADGSIRFLAHGTARDVYLTASGLVTSGVTLRFLGGNSQAATLGLDPLPGRRNYFQGATARTNIPTFQRVRYVEVYPRIDVLVYGDQRGVEYDFHVAPHADPSRIRLRWEGAHSIRLDAAGDLAIEAASGALRQRKPMAYQEQDGRRTIIPSRYVLVADNEVCFSLGVFDHSRTLVIDPVLFAIDSSTAYPRAMALDPAGNIYLAGTTQTSILPVASRVVQPRFGGGTCVSVSSAPIGGFTSFPCPDAYVIKLDPAGEIIYVTYLGGTGFDYGFSIAADSAGNAYVAGTTSTNTLPNNFPTTPNAAYPQPSEGGIGVDRFVAKLSPAGDKLVYSTYLPGAGWGAMMLALDPQGNAYVASSAMPGRFPATPGAFQAMSSSRAITGVVAKLNPSGSALVYATYLGGSGGVRVSSRSDDAIDITVDSSGTAYVTGFTISTDFPTTRGAFQEHDFNPGGAAFVVKLNASGTAAIYSTLLAGSDADQGQRIKVDAQGNAYVLGRTASKDFPLTAGAFQPAGPEAPWSSNGGFLAKLNPAGSALIFSTYLTGGIYDLDLDAEGNAYVLGQASYGFPVTLGALQACMNGGESDILAAQFTPDGKLAGATYLGGSQE